ncbi:hypothetical protein GCM10023187_44630 [Nibrella viscosa]|uniref:DUF4843 domain-containing protein n=1 Tax=Nibrella viscosa TaxID=1084524 RepID=A0ABP8KRW7_9BACT
MKNILGFAVALLMLFGMTSCFEDLDKTFDEKTVVEFQTAITSTPAVGRTYPLISAGNSATAVTLTQRINLVGKQRSADETIKVSVDKENSTAVEGTHFTLANGGNVVIPANSSFGTVTVTVPRGTAAASVPAVNLVLVIEGNGRDILPSENYKRVGFSIRP